MKRTKWPLRYRLAHRAHCLVNRVHSATGEHPVTWRLNCKVGSLWIPWWMDRGRFEYVHNSD